MEEEEVEVEEGGVRRKGGGMMLFRCCVVLKCKLVFVVHVSSAVCAIFLSLDSHSCMLGSHC